MEIEEVTMVFYVQFPLLSLDKSGIVSLIFGNFNFNHGYAYLNANKFKGG